MAFWVIWGNLVTWPQNIPFFLALVLWFSLYCPLVVKDIDKFILLSSLLLWCILVG
jgi:hypothetical protein